jgi:hypothetical protein
MDYFVSILSFIEKIGTFPSLILIGVLLGFFVRELKENGRRDEARAKELKAFVAKEVQELREANDARHRQTDEAVEELARRLSSVEKDYLPRDEHYRDFSGWRAEINRLCDLIIQVIKEIPKK